MYPRTEYEMTEGDFKKLIESMKPVPCIMVGNYSPPSQQENANSAWEALGKKMGFDYMTVRPIEGKGNRFFTAVPSETESQRKERIEKEAEEKKQLEIKKLEDEISEKQEILNKLRAKK